MLLCAFDINDRQFRHWPANRGHFLFGAHRAPFCSLYATDCHTANCDTILGAKDSFSILV